MDRQQTQSKTATVEPDGRQRILQAAHDLFVTFGYASVSMQQIASAAGIQKATLYHHFLNKEALFAEVVRMAYGEIRDEVEAVIKQGGRASDQLVRVAWQIFARSQSDFGRLMTDVHEQISPDQRSELLAERRFPWELFEQIFAQAVREGELPDVDQSLAISLFIGVIWGQIWVRKIERVSTPPDEQLARSIVDILFAGLRNTPPVPA